MHPKIVPCLFIIILFRFRRLDNMTSQFLFRSFALWQRGCWCHVLIPTYQGTLWEHRFPEDPLELLVLSEGKTLLSGGQRYCTMLITCCASGAAESRRAPSKSRRQNASLDFRAPPQILVFIVFSIANRLSRRTRLRLDRHAKDSDFQTPHS